MRTTLAVLLGSSLLLVGCGQSSPEVADDPNPVEPSATVVATADPLGTLAAIPPQDPKDFTWQDELFHFLTADGEVIDRPPWTACLHNGCWDGAPGLGEKSIPSVGSPDSLYFAFAYPGWDFEYVSFHPVDRDCGGRVISVPAEKMDERLFRVDPAGLAGEWRVDVFGYGKDGGDAVTSIRWTTPTDGTVPDPKATGAVFGDASGERTTYGPPELHLRDLAATPRVATGTMTVADENGTSVSVPLTRRKFHCEDAGAFSMNGAELSAQQLRRLTGTSYTYTVDLRLDGERYTGTAVWPRDELADEAPYTAFTFDPPLPAYGG